MIVSRKSSISASVVPRKILALSRARSLTMSASSTKSLITCSAIRVTAISARAPAGSSFSGRI